MRFMRLLPVLVLVLFVALFFGFKALNAGVDQTDFIPVFNQIEEAAMIFNEENVGILAGLQETAPFKVYPTAKEVVQVIDRIKWYQEEVDRLENLYFGLEHPEQWQVENVKAELMLNDDKEMLNEDESMLEALEKQIENGFLLSPVMTLPDTYNHRERPWYIKTMTDDTYDYSPPFVDAFTGDWIITLSQVVEVDQTKIGVLGMDMTLNELFEKADLIASLDDYNVLILGENDNILYDSNRLIIPSSLEEMGLEDLTPGYQMRKVDDVKTDIFLGRTEHPNLKIILLKER